MCYSMALESKHNANRLVARNALLQIAITAFKRLESDLCYAHTQAEPAPSGVPLKTYVAVMKLKSTHQFKFIKEG